MGLYLLSILTHSIFAYFLISNITSKEFIIFKNTSLNALFSRIKFYLISISYIYVLECFASSRIAVILVINLTLIRSLCLKIYIAIAFRFIFFLSQKNGFRGKGILLVVDGGRM